MSLNDQNSFLRSQPSSASGKTPPPAPSAMYAKRTVVIPYRPPALRTINSGDSPPPSSADTGSTLDSLPPPPNYPPGFRRARAGTLPSNIQLAAARHFAASSSSPFASQTEFGVLDNTFNPLDLPQTNNSRGSSSPPLTAAHSRPALKHAATTVLSSDRASRLRSGSLTLPASGLSSGPFGPSLFNSGWLSGSRAARGEVPQGVEANDDFDVHTLDYLGLDDSGRHRQQNSHPIPATLTELRAQAQAAVTGGLSAGGNGSTTIARNRATTVSNPYTRFGVGGLPGTNNRILDDNELLMQDYSELSLGLGVRGYETLTNSVSARNRANTIGNLDLLARMRSMGSTTYDDPDASYDDMPGAQNLYSGGGILKDSSKRGNGNVGHAQAATVRFPATTGYSRTDSPKVEIVATTAQTPSRSLWIGNLDPTFSSEDLIRVFAPYGAIESLRLLPEKECGFVNFVEQTDAIRAKDDVLNRLGGMIGMTNGQAVRVGFGKPDSAPVAPAKSTAVVTPQGIATPGGATHLKSPGIAQSVGLVPAVPAVGLSVEPVQSTPTRALWIGSIPSTTTPAQILSVFAPFGPIESARVLTHKNCGFINFERLDDAVRARKALNGRDVLGSDVGAIRIGFARVPTKNGGQDVVGSPDEPLTTLNSSGQVQGIGEMSVGATIHALRGVKGATTVSADQQVLSGSLENYRSNLLISMVVANGAGDGGMMEGNVLVTEQQMIMKALGAGSPETEEDVKALADFRPPTMYYTTIPAVTERPHSKRWDASKLRELRKKLDSGTMGTEEIDEIAADFLDGEIVDLASDWLGNTVVQKLFEKCSHAPRFAMLERIAPHLAMIGIHKNGTWAAQKIIECVKTPEEISLVTQHLKAYTPPLLLDQFGNYVVQCCLRFGSPDNDFVFDAMVDRLWEIAQGRFGARSMRACLESNHITLSQQRRLATAVILNSIPLATNPNGALLLTWLLDTSNFPSRYSLLAPRFTPHLSHLCTHKLASLTVLRLVNQKVEPSAASQVVEGLFMSLNDHVLTDVLGDQVNGVAVVHKILTSPFLQAAQKEQCIETTKRVLTELKVIATQAYRRLIEEVGLQVTSYQGNYAPQQPTISQQQTYAKSKALPGGYPLGQQDLTPMLANLQVGSVPGGNSSGFSPVGGNPSLLVNASYPQQSNSRRSTTGYSPNADPFNPFALRSPDMAPISLTRQDPQLGLNEIHQGTMSGSMHAIPYNTASANLVQPGNVLGMNQPGPGYSVTTNVLPPHLYQAYYQMYQQQNPQNVGTYQ